MWQPQRAVTARWAEAGSPLDLMIAAQQKATAMIPEVDPEGIAGDPRLIRTVLHGDCEVVCMAVYGHVGVCIKGANFALLQHTRMRACGSSLLPETSQHTG